MIPKTCDLTNAWNYTPIVILEHFYKIFSRISYKRLLPIMDAQQSEKQAGFRKGIRIEDSLMIFESVISRCTEFNLSLWVVRLDLKKTFDRDE